MMTSTRNSRNTNHESGGLAHSDSDVLRNEDFRRMASLLYDKTGIVLAPIKKTLLEGRLRKRVRTLGLQSIEHYCHHLFSAEGQLNELEFFINVLTTNKTDFMREFGHFQYLTAHILPRLLRKRRQVEFWSAACSRGAEPYTLSMVLEEFIRENPNCGLQYRILATDISTKVLDEAVQAIYDEDEVAPVPEAWRKRYLLRGKGNRSGQVRIVPELREKVRFQHLNLMESFDGRKQFDVIFCRNVTIYFDRETQNRLVRKFLSVIPADGYLIMGHSESLDLQANPIRACSPSIYQKV